MACGVISTALGLSHMVFVRSPMRHAQNVCRFTLIVCSVIITSLIAPDGATAKSDGARVKVGAMLQVRHAYELPIDDPSTGADEGAADPVNSFLLRRGRIRLQVKRDGLKLKGGFGFSKDEPRLLSLYLQAKLPGDVVVRVGQTKRLLTQSYLESSATQRLIERAAIGDEVGSNRDVGLRLRRQFFGKKLDLQAGIFNGNGPNTVANDTGGFLLEGRVDVHLLRRLDLTDPSINRKLAIVVGGAFSRGAVTAARFKGGEQLTKVDISQAWSVHAAIRWQRVELRAELLSHDKTPEDARADTSSPLGVDGKEEGGWAVQLAWQPPLRQRRLELSARLNRWEDSRGDVDTRSDELEACVGWRFIGDRLKLQAVWRDKTKHRAGGVSFVERRVQLQLQAEL